MSELFRANSDFILLSTHPYEDELLWSWLWRIALINKLRNPEQLLAGLIDKSIRRHSDDWYGQLACATKVKDLRLRRLHTGHAYPFRHLKSSVGPYCYFLPPPRSGVRFNDEISGRSRVAFCPVCLAEGGYVRHFWVKNAYCFCARHQCLAIEYCGSCRCAVTVECLVRQKCSNCGSVLTSKNLIYTIASKEGRLENSIVHYWLAGKAADNQVHGHGLPEQNQTVLLELVLRIVTMLWSNLHVWPSLVESGWVSGDGETLKNLPVWVQGSRKAFDAFSIAFGALKDWPQGFFDFLDTSRGLAQTTQMDKALHTLVGDDRELLSCARPDHRFAFVQSAYHEYSRKFVPYVRSGFKRARMRVRPTNPHHMDRGSEETRFLVAFAKITGVSIRQAGVLIDTRSANEDGSHRTTGKGYPTSSYERAFVQAQDYMSYGMSVKSCAHLLGVDSATIGHLVEHNVLTSHCSWDASASGHEHSRVSYTSAWQLQLNLVRNQVELDGHKIAFHEAEHRLSAEGFTAVRLVAAMSLGDVLVQYGERRFSDCHVAADSLYRFIERQNQLREIQRVENLAKTLRVAPTMALKWLELDFLPRKMSSGTDDAYTLAEEDIHTFREEYVRLVEGPEIVGIPEALFHHRVGRGLIPEVGREQSVSTGLFKREDIEDLAPRRSILPSEAVREFGISEEAIWASVDEGLVTPLTKVASKFTGFCRFVRDEVELLAQSAR